MCSITDLAQVRSEVQRMYVGLNCTPRPTGFPTLLHLVRKAIRLEQQRACLYDFHKVFAPRDWQQIACFENPKTFAYTLEPKTFRLKRSGYPPHSHGQLVLHLGADPRTLKILTFFATRDWPGALPTSQNKSSQQNFGPVPSLLEQFCSHFSGNLPIYEALVGTDLVFLSQKTIQK